MTRCKHCGFSSEDEFLSMIGAPCGYDGCPVFTCCIEAWKEHMKEVHPEWKE